MDSEVVGALIRSRLDIGQTIGFQIRTTSMQPTLEPGDLLIVKSHRDTGLLERGTLLVFQQDNTWIAHRFIELVCSPTGDKILTKGDSRSLFDPLWDADQLCGSGVEIRRDDRVIDLNSNRARITGKWIGRFSSHIGRLNSNPQTVLTRFRVRAEWKLLRVFSKLGYGIIS